MAFFVRLSFALFGKIKKRTIFEKLFGHSTHFGHVRQLVDSLPYKEEVRGSSPFVPTIAGS